MAAIEMGTGILTWNRGERVSDRYGAVYLMEDGRDRQAKWAARIPEGTKGELRAVVLETRQSGHIGDFFRGTGPVTPNIGEVIVLGSGSAFFDPKRDGFEPFGLAPDDDRDSDWLDPRALYRCHSQTVRLEFLPASE